MRAHALSALLCMCGDGSISNTHAHQLMSQCADVPMQTRTTMERVRQTKPFSPTHHQINPPHSPSGISAHPICALVAVLPPPFCPHNCTVDRDEFRHVLSNLGGVLSFSNEEVTRPGDPRLLPCCAHPYVSSSLHLPPHIYARVHVGPMTGQGARAPFKPFL